MLFFVALGNFRNVAGLCRPAVLPRLTVVVAFADGSPKGARGLLVLADVGVVVLGVVFPSDIQGLSVSSVEIET